MPVQGSFFKYITLMHSQNTPAQIKSRSPLAVVREWTEMIKLEHTVFALPFALSGLILASVGARSAAMTLNRVIDAGIDSKNPRTKDRAIAAGRIKPAVALFFAVLSFGLMLFAASKLPLICLQLSPIAVVWLSFYSFTKRFTWLCHIVLGIALGGAALGGWAAAAGNVSGLAPWLLALAVSTWVAGFDIIYACQDYNIDTNQKIKSIPARFGIGRALLIARFLHVLTVANLMWLGACLHLGIFYGIGFAAVAVMLVYEHSLVKPDDLSKVNAAFFNVNGFVSIACFVAILLDKTIKF
jgi:4-hydroxybenzoate polyprenyltransferase